jgi:ketosteroid isomerase-like protein
VSPQRLYHTRDDDELLRKWPIFFESLPQADDIHAFEPREFIEAGEHVTVLGWEKTTAIDTKKLFETEWVHVFTVKSGKITRWRGFFDTAARYVI